MYILALPLRWLLPKREKTKLFFPSGGTYRPAHHLRSRRARPIGSGVFSLVLSGGETFMGHTEYKNGSAGILLAKKWGSILFRNPNRSILRRRRRQIYRRPLSLLIWIPFTSKGFAQFPPSLTFDKSAPHVRLYAACCNI